MDEVKQKISDLINPDEASEVIGANGKPIKQEREDLLAPEIIAMLDKARK